MRRFVVPGIPFVVSFALSLWTAGSSVYWQDSGYFLVAIRELGVLYPPGFPLYILLCKAWTVALWFLDFTYAVHLFSATCAAIAAGTIAVAARDLLRTKGPIFHTAQEEGPLAEWVGVAVGCLAASGYTFWASAILAKGYAFYFMMLSLLLWRMIRADESGKPRDFTIVAVLIGLSWQAHPSAVNLGLALVLFVAFHRGVVGWKGIAWRTGLAAVCALGFIHALPWMASRGSAVQFGQPQGWSGFWEYATGSRFTTIPGAFGVDGTRVASVFKYFWEEFLVVGIVLVAAGAYRLWGENRRLLFGIAAWVVPVLVVTTLFKLEGQHDFWMVAAWIPLWLLAAGGLSLVGKGREIAVVVALIGVVWAVVANRKDLDQRDYDVCEQFGKYYLRALPDAAELNATSDDVYGACVYLQRIGGLRRDVTLYSGIHNSFRSYGIDSAVFYEKVHSPNDSFMPDGPLWRRRNAPPAKWVEGMTAEELPKLFRRPRGQQVARTETEVRVHPEPYEARFLRVLLLTRKTKADELARKGDLAEAERLYGTIFTLDPGMKEEPSLLLTYAVLEIGLKKYDAAGEHLRQALASGLAGEPQARAYYFLAALSGDKPEAAEWKSKALSHPALAPELRAKLEGR